MGKAISLEVDEQLKVKSNNFIKNIKSGMHLTSDINSDINDLEWLEIIEEVCPYLDNIVRTPKVALVSESEVTKIEKAKKTSVDTVLNYIECINNSMIVSKVNRYNIRGKSVMSLYEKYYMADLGFLHLKSSPIEKKLEEELKI